MHKSESSPVAGSIGLVVVDNGTEEKCMEGHLVMRTCDFLETLYSADESGGFCDRHATAKCSVCGRSVCDKHAEECIYCISVFCSGCMRYHMSAHAFPPQAEVSEKLEQSK